MNQNEGATSGSWKIEPGKVVSKDGVDEIIGIFHEKNDPIYVDREDLGDLIGALMLFLDVKKIEACE